MARLRSLRPLDSVGWSILIYRPDFAWTIPAPGAAGSADLPAEPEGEAQQDQ
jgi:hypothetical protein